MIFPRSCPHCSSAHIFRSRRKLVEYLMPFHKPFRCYEPGCELRSLLSQTPIARRPVALTPSLRTANSPVFGQ